MSSRRVSPACFWPPVPPRFQPPTWRKPTSCPCRSTTITSSARSSSTITRKSRPASSRRASRFSSSSAGVEWGAVDNIDRRALFGNYFTFFWWSKKRADVTIRLEYRQADLGNYVSAQERYYPNAKGSFRSEFSVIGDEFLESGRVTSWRAILIVDGKIVALKQSFLWK